MFSVRDTILQSCSARTGRRSKHIQDEIQFQKYLHLYLCWHGNWLNYATWCLLPSDPAYLPTRQGPYSCNQPPPAVHLVFHKLMTLKKSWKGRKGLCRLWRSKNQWNMISRQDIGALGGRLSIGIIFWEKPWTTKLKFWTGIMKYVR